MGAEQEVQDVVEQGVSSAEEPELLPLMQKHYTKAQNVCDHIDQIIEAITIAHKECLNSRQAYMRAKAKCFGNSLMMLANRQAEICFVAWRGVYIHRKCKLLDATIDEEQKAWELRLLEQELEHEEEISNLEEMHRGLKGQLDLEADQCKEHLDKVKDLRDQARDRAAKNVRFVHCISQTIGAHERAQLPKATHVKQIPMDGDATDHDWLVWHLHKLLDQIDPNYAEPFDLKPSGSSPKERAKCGKK